MTGAPAKPRRRLRASPLGLYLGGLICALTFTPSLIPRPWEAQGALAGLGFALGYGGGVLIARLWAWLELPVASVCIEFHRQPVAKQQRQARTGHLNTSRGTTCGHRSEG